MPFVYTSTWWPQNAADLRPDAYTYGSLIAACAKVRDAAKALSLLDEMLAKSDEVDPTTVVFNSCITACGQAGRWEDAREVFEKLKQEIEKRGGLESSDLYVGMAKRNGRNVRRGVRSRWSGSRRRRRRFRAR